MSHHFPTDITRRYWDRSNSFISDDRNTEILEGSSIANVNWRINLKNNSMLPPR